MNDSARPFPEAPPRALPGSWALAPERSALIVGITGDGFIPVVEHLDAATGRSIIGLPSVSLGGTQFQPDQTRERVVGHLRREFGYAAGEIVPMWTRSAPFFFLAPLLAIADWRASIRAIPGVYEVAMGAFSEWLTHRRLAGAEEEASLRFGLRLAEDAFPRWAQERVGRGLLELSKRTAGPIAPEGSLRPWGPIHAP